MPLSMKRAKLRIAGVSGRYVLTHYDGLPLADGPGHVHFDSLFLDTDGRARRHRSQMSLSYNRPGVYERRGDWIVFSYSPVGGPYIPSWDSLRVDRGGMVRTTSRSLIGMPPLEEVYERLR